MQLPPPPRAVTLNDIADALGQRPKFLSGDISAALRLEIPLRDGRVLLLQEGDTDDHHRVEVLDANHPGLTGNGG